MASKDCDFNLQVISTGMNSADKIFEAVWHWVMNSEKNFEMDDSDTSCSRIALPELCSGELKMAVNSPLSTDFKKGSCQILIKDCAFSTG